MQGFTCQRQGCRLRLVISGDPEDPRKPRLYHAKPKPTPVGGFPAGELDHTLSVTGNAGCPAPLTIVPGVPEPLPGKAPKAKASKPSINSNPQIYRGPKPAADIPVADIDEEMDPRDLDLRGPKE